MVVGGFANCRDVPQDGDGDGAPAMESSFGFDDPAGGSEHDGGGDSAANDER